MDPGYYLLSIIDNFRRFLFHHINIFIIKIDGILTWSYFDYLKNSIIFSNEIISIPILKNGGICCI